MSECKQDEVFDRHDKESHLRSILKGISYRLIGTLTTIAIAYSFTGEVQLAMQVGLVEVVSKVIIYYAHERLWQMVPRGTIRRIIGRG